MTDQLISNKKLALIGVVSLFCVFYFQDSLPDVTAVQLPEIVVPIEPVKEKEVIQEEKEKPVPPPREINLSELTEKDRSDPPFFKTFDEEIGWYASFGTPSGVPNITETECDPLVRSYKMETEFNLRVHLAKKIQEACFG